MYKCKQKTEKQKKKTDFPLKKDSSWRSPLFKWRSPYKCQRKKKKREEKQKKREFFYRGKTTTALNKKKDVLKGVDFYKKMPIFFPNISIENQREKRVGGTTGYSNSIP